MSTNRKSGEEKPFLQAINEVYISIASVTLMQVKRDTDGIQNVSGVYLIGLIFYKMKVVVNFLRWGKVFVSAKCFCEQKSACVLFSLTRISESDFLISYKSWTIWHL